MKLKSEPSWSPGPFLKIGLEDVFFLGYEKWNFFFTFISIHFSCYSVSRLIWSRSILKATYCDRLTLSFVYCDHKCLFLKRTHKATYRAIKKKTQILYLYIIWLSLWSSLENKVLDTNQTKLIFNSICRYGTASQKAWEILRIEGIC